MKQKDIGLIVVVVIFAGVVSVLVTQTFFIPKKRQQLTAEKVEAIVAEFDKPDPTVFNPNGINPTQLIQIGDTSNPAPF